MSDTFHDGTRWNRHGPMVLAAICGAALLVGYVGELRAGLASWVLLAYSISYASGSWFGLIEVWRTFKARVLDINFLMLIAAAGAALIRQWHEGATLLFLFSVSNALQAYALGRTRTAIRSLMALRPHEARVVTSRGNGHDDEVRTVLDDVPVGAMIRLRPGERVPLDAIILEGRTTLDESSLTGESMPVDRGPGDLIRAGTMNLNGSVDAQVERTASDSTLARIIRLVEEARGQKAKAQQIIDRFGVAYTYAVLVGALGVFLVLSRFAALPFAEAFYRTMVVLVVASPCALVISTPAAVLSGIARGAQLGILFKGGVHLETMGRISAVALDKTGTLTPGRPVVSRLFAVNAIREEDLLQQAASIEKFSEHPLAEAVVGEAIRRQLALVAVDEPRAVPGQGIEGLLQGVRLRVGRGSWTSEGRELPHDLRLGIADIEAEGATVITVARDGSYLGAIGLMDQIRPGAREAMNALRHAGIRHLAIISGDSEKIARHIGQEVGADIVKARLTPEEKVEAVRDLRRDYGTVAMVGDGVNDTPALAAASVGIAMGGRGTDAALETADIILMKDDLSRLATAVELGRKARSVIIQNLTFSICVILVLVTISLAARFPLAWGVLGHEGSTVIVVLNSLRLLAYRPGAAPEVRTA
jgi:Cd2+/Zn2+-exporting ATPase